MNCSQIIGFHTFDSTDSDTLIGKNNNLQDITVKGRCKIKNSEGIVETQIFYLEEDEIEELLKDKVRDKMLEIVDEFLADLKEQEIKIKVDDININFLYISFNISLALCSVWYLPKHKS